MNLRALKQAVALMLFISAVGIDAAEPSSRFISFKKFCTAALKGMSEVFSPGTLTSVEAVR